jgi:hypothetical protein
MLALQFQIDGRAVAGSAERRPSLAPAPRRFACIRQRDKNIYLPCIGWMVPNGAVVAGAVVYG